MYCLTHELPRTVNVPDVYYVENEPWVMNYWGPWRYVRYQDGVPVNPETNWWQQDFAQSYQNMSFSEVHMINVKQHYTVAP